LLTVKANKERRLARTCTFAGGRGGRGHNFSGANDTGAEANSWKATVRSINHEAITGVPGLELKEKKERRRFWREPFLRDRPGGQRTLLLPLALPSGLKKSHGHPLVGVAGNMVEHVDESGREGARESPTSRCCCQD